MPRTGQRHVVRFFGVENLLEFKMVIDKVLFETFEARKVLAHYMNLSVSLTPLQITEPSGGVRQDFYFT